jgi:hypothetical protein
MNSNLKPGDKVQELHGTGAGVVKTILPGGRVLVSSEEWDELEYHSSQLILLESPVANENGPLQEDILPEVEKRLDKQEGIWLGFRAKPGTEMCQLIARNQTQTPVFLHFLVKPGTETGKSVYKEIIPVGKEADLYEFLPPVNGTGELWSFHLLFLTKGTEDPISPLVSTKRFRPKDYHKSKESMGQICWFTSLQADVPVHESETLNRGENRNHLPARVVDLHHEKVVDVQSRSLMTDQDILREQIRVFQENLDKAIAGNKDSIIFIHGIGSGILKQAIIDFITTHPYPVVLRAEPAAFKEFGAGAMEIFIE